LDKVTTASADPVEKGRLLTFGPSRDGPSRKVDALVTWHVRAKMIQHRKHIVLKAAAWWLAAGMTWGIACVAAAQTDASFAGSNAARRETIRERFPDGRLRIEREVTTDAAGNYVNHGRWRMWNTDGELVAEGSYDMGRRTGRWMRCFERDEVPLLSTAPFDQFESPFSAEANFDADQLHGEWIIVDARDRKCSRVALKYGKRNGPAVLWLPDGTVYREAAFRNGAPDGELRQRSTDGKLQTVATYVGGQQLANKVTHFPETLIRQSEVSCLVATISEVAADDFWQLRFAEYGVRNEPLRHGSWKCWYANGQQQAEGYFQYDREMGPFTWWHAHGQEAVKGRFVDGRPDGVWTWWHTNGQKAAEGEYRNGRQVGAWKQWAEDGRLVQNMIAKPAAPAQGSSNGQVRVTEQATNAINGK
jgi:antitoxin component YwqK of YwqJK toxin-antitoxin module